MARSQRKSSPRKHGSTRRKGGSGGWLAGSNVFWGFVAFVVFVAFTGGASRYDVESLPVLRAVAALVIAFALWKMPLGRLAAVKWPLVLLGALALTMAIQLVPLPPESWSALPGRELIYRIGVAAGMGDLWRPITFSPARTWNSLASLVVPVAGLFLFAWMDRAERRRALWAFLAVGGVSALMGVAQLVLPAADNLYLYAITNREDAVGLFANRNHNAMFLACCLLATLDRLQENWKAYDMPLRLGVGALAGLLTLSILVNASRAGLLLLLIVLVIVSARQVFAPQPESGKGKSLVRRFAPVGGAALALLVIGVLLFAQDRMSAITRLQLEDPLGGQRVEYLPLFFDMVGEHIVLGTGFGAFQEAFRTIEPSEVLGPRYLNNAHNDWLQFFIEGGVFAVAIFLALAILLLRRVPALFKRSDAAGGRSLQQSRLAFAIIGLIALASILDYPLRTPLMMIFAMYFLAVFLRPIDDAENGLSVAQSRSNA